MELKTNNDLAITNIKNTDYYIVNYGKGYKFLINLNKDVIIPFISEKQIPNKYYNDLGINLNKAISYNLSNFKLELVNISDLDVNNKSFVINDIDKYVDNFNKLEFDLISNSIIKLNNRSNSIFYLTNETVNNLYRYLNNPYLTTDLKLAIVDLINKGNEVLNNPYLLEVVQNE